MLFKIANFKRRYYLSGVRDQVEKGRNYGKGFINQQWLGLLCLVGRAEAGFLKDHSASGALRLHANFTQAMHPENTDEILRADHGGIASITVRCSGAVP